MQFYRLQLFFFFIIFFPPIFLPFTFFISNYYNYFLIFTRCIKFIFLFSISCTKQLPHHIISLIFLPYFPIIVTIHLPCYLLFSILKKKKKRNVQRPLQLPPSTFLQPPFPPLPPFLHLRNSPTFLPRLSSTILASTARLFFFYRPNPATV